MLSDILNKSNPVNQQKEMSKSEYKKLVDRNTELIDKLKQVKEEIRILESNCDISEYQAQKLYNLIDKGEK